MAVAKSAVKLEELYVLNAYQVISEKLKPPLNILIADALYHTPCC